MLLAGRPLETVRRQLQHEGSELKGSLWSLRGNAWHLSHEVRNSDEISVHSTPPLAGRCLSARRCKSFTLALITADCIFNTGASRAAPVRDAMISVLARSRSRTR